MLDDSIENIDISKTDSEIAAAYHDTKLAQIIYHDWEAQTYDSKWSIAFDERCVEYAVSRFNKIMSGSINKKPYTNALEIGCGTGFFLLNLMLGGVISKGNVTDISPGMVKVALDNAKNLNLSVTGRIADAETIPYPDNSFDLVIGHAVLHHIPDVKLALTEVLRVLRPGGRFVFAGEPTKIGDKYARKISTWTWKLVTNITKLWFLRSWKLPKAKLAASSKAAALEAIVDLHTFDPKRLEQLAVAAGAKQVKTQTDEFTAALFGWPVRTFEAAIPKGKLGFKWANFAYKTWKKLNWLDDKILAKFIPAKFYYNVMLTGIKD